MLFCLGLLLSGAGKTAAGLSTMALLGADDYDFSDTVIVSVVCAEGSAGTCVYGNVVLITAACDLQLGHHTGWLAIQNPAKGLTWFPDDTSFLDYKCKLLNPALYEKAYSLIQDCPLRTTEITKQVLAEIFPGEPKAERASRVLKGTAVTADSCWKG